MRWGLLTLTLTLTMSGPGCAAIARGEPVEVLQTYVEGGALAGGAIGLPVCLAFIPITLPVAATEIGDAGPPDRVEPLCDPFGGFAAVFVPAVPTAMAGAAVGAIFGLPATGIAVLVKAARQREAYERERERERLSARARRASRSAGRRGGG